METLGTNREQKYTAGDILVRELHDDEGRPTKYFKCTSVDHSWGGVGYTCRGIKDTIGFAYVRKANFFEKMLYELFYQIYNE